MREKKICKLPVFVSGCSSLLQTAHDNRASQRHGGGRNSGPKVTIEPGDAGIWATCDRNKEAKCVGELRDLFQEVRSSVAMVRIMRLCH